MLSTHFVQVELLFVWSMIFSFTDVEHTIFVLCATVETQFGSHMYVEEMPLLIAGDAPVGDGVKLCDALQVWIPTSKAAAVTSFAVE